MTKRGDTVAIAVEALRNLVNQLPEPKTEADMQMFVKFWTAYAICKADHSARLLTDVHKSGGGNEKQG